MKKQYVETLTEIESRQATQREGGRRLLFRILSTQLRGLGLRRGDVVEVKRRTEVKPGRLMLLEVNGAIVFGRAYPHDCARLRLEWAGGAASSARSITLSRSASPC